MDTWPAVSAGASRRAGVDHGHGDTRRRGGPVSERPASHRSPSSRSRQGKAAAISGHSQIWTDPGDLTPAALLAGPPLEDGSGVEAALDGRPFPCTFAMPGKTMGGNTKKFACTTTTGKTIRVKYTRAVEDGNREVFAAVAASRLLWALGFKSDPIYPICDRLPGLPRRSDVTGTGTKEQRSYLAIYSADIHRPGDGGRGRSRPGLAMGGARCGDRCAAGR